MVYQYLTGPRFRHRVEAIVEAFSTMQGDLDRERKAIMKQWAKREVQIDRVMQATVGMYGDLQGIAGKTLQEIEGLEIYMESAIIGETVYTLEAGFVGYPISDQEPTTASEPTQTATAPPTQPPASKSARAEESSAR